VCGCELANSLVGPAVLHLWGPCSIATTSQLTAPVNPSEHAASQPENTETKEVTHLAMRF
jgi:hypothetical protein